MSKLVIIRGNSGSGKTSAAKALRHRLGHNVMLLSQDMVRRDILRVKDGADTKALPLLCELLVYGSRRCEAVILEGILYSAWYMPLFRLAKEEFGNQIWGYYYDIPFDETLARHATRSSRNDFGAEDMMKWRHDRDFMGIIPEKVISKETSLTEAVDMMMADISAPSGTYRQS